jgi:hypothetical protein
MEQRGKADGRCAGSDDGYILSPERLQLIDFGAVFGEPGGQVIEA